MVENYIEAAYQWHLIGAQRFTFHSETIRDIKEIVAFKSECSCEVGIAANNDSPLTALTKHIEHFDFVQVMGIATIGAQGSKFDNRALVRVLEIKAAFPDAVVQIDGSVNESTLPQLRDAGADRFVVGSAILNAENPEGMYRTLDKLAKEMQ